MPATKITSSSTMRIKKVKSSIGAPSQRAQASRKGKKAWRKNVDLDEVEEGLEQLRTEERVTGSVLQKKTNDELFQVDLTGDEKVRKRLPKFSASLLTSTKIINQRSAIPAVFSRTQSSSSSSQKRRKLTHEEKDRLLRIGKKLRKGPFNAVMDPTELGAGSALIEVSDAVKMSGGYDIWAIPKEVEVEENEGANVPNKNPKVKQPATPHPRDHIALSAVPAPHEGTSYNPPLTSYQILLRTAHEQEEKRVKQGEELQNLKDKFIGARRAAEENGAAGMPVDVPAEDDDDVEEDEAQGEVLVKKASERKTKQERIKAAKRRAEKRALAEKLNQKRFLSAVYMAKSLRKNIVRSTAERERHLLEQHKQKEEERIKKGLAGQKLGKHVVPGGDVDVQLGEDLSESLRALKPEGNLFRDRFLSMQHRALIEPRIPVVPTKQPRYKEYEKHAYKQFDRDLQ